MPAPIAQAPVVLDIAGLALSAATGRFRRELKAHDGFLGHAVVGRWVNLLDADPARRAAHLRTVTEARDTMVPALAMAVAMMAEQDIGSVVVMEYGELVGMLTFREVLKALKQAGPGWSTLAVSGIMVKEPTVAGPEMEVDALRRLMVEQHMRYLPVMDGGTLMGVISFHDVARAVLEEQSFENRMLKSYIKSWPDE